MTNVLIVLTHSSTKKCGCPFMLRSKSLKDDLCWTDKVTCGVSNHELPDILNGHTFVGCLDEEEQKHVHDLTNIMLHWDILLLLQDWDNNNITQISQIYKQMSMIRL